MASAPFASRRSRVQLGVLCMALVWIAMWFVGWTTIPHSDEWLHYYQSLYFSRGNFEVYVGTLTNIPTYHVWLALLMKVFGFEALGAARVVNSLYGLGALGALYAIRRTLHQADALRSTAQLMFLPPLFVFFFIAYTDVLALALILAALLACLRGRHGWAALALLLATAVRQPSVLWAVCFALVAAWPVLQRAYAAAPWRVATLAPHAKDTLRIVWPYIGTVVAFFVYWAWNGSISFSNAQAEEAHPDLKFDVGNPYFLLFLAGCLLPLQTWAGLRRFAVAARRRPWLWLVPVAVFALYATAFEVAHPYNTFAGDYFLHNMFLQRLAVDRVLWGVVGLGATLAACGLGCTRFALPQGWLVLPFGVLFVAASWLIEPRYAIVPLALLLALRGSESDRGEAITLALWAVAAVYVAWGVFEFRFFP
ncbi:hypothetical protein [Chiayiivirga flava]|uniref:Glycosyltransferase RgtA/B/C/D-like domain-containing protein n=1 Tax=Chiayiivirga flava TaxID=659595 RepID=A0A7W8D888_9GAMM|nr:hypothetical protein [Chiayiivirga flava]MBB5209749.1 hypothetical protein [Chiayiivirga flava]